MREYIWWPVASPEALGALGRKIYIDAGFDECGAVREVFARGGSKHGEQIDFGLDALAIDLSLSLQSGTSLLELAELAPQQYEHHLCPPEAGAALRLSARVVIAAIVHRLIQIECDVGPDKRRAA